MDQAMTFHNGVVVSARTAAPATALAPKANVRRDDDAWRDATADDELCRDCLWQAGADQTSVEPADRRGYQAKLGAKRRCAGVSECPVTGPTGRPPPQGNRVWCGVVACGGGQGPLELQRNSPLAG